MTPNRVIALTQFVFLALGALAVNVLVKIHNTGSDTSKTVSRAVEFLSANGVWLLALSAIWFVYAEVSRNIGKEGFLLTLAQGVGVVLAAAIVIVYGWVILSF